MAVVAQLMVNIGADTSKFDSGMKDISRNLSDAGKNALSFGDILTANVLSDAIVGGFKALGGAVAEMAGGLKDFAISGLETASDLSEVQNVVDTTFGKEGAGKIESFAKTASTSFGLSELSAKQFTGTMGAMLKSTGLSGASVEEMSMGVAGLAGDFASFYNLPTEEAFAKIRSGISGETEPLKQLGINMSAASLETYAMTQGLSKSYKEMSEAEKTTLRYNYIMQATADAQGDFAKTSGSYANQQRIMDLNMQNLATTIGSQLLPMANQLTTAFNQLLTGEISAEEFGTTVGNVILELANKIIEQLPMLIDVGIKIISAIINGIALNLPMIMESALTILNQLTTAFLTLLPQLIDIGMQILSALIDGIIQNLPKIMESAVGIITQLTTAIIQMLPKIIEMGLQILIQLALGIAKALPTLIPTIVDTMLKIVDVLIDNIDMLIDAALQLMIGLANGLIKALPKLIEKAPTIISKLVSAIIRNLPLIISAAWQIIKALAGALIKNLPQILASAGKIIVTLVSGIGKGLGSINKAMSDIGKDIASSVSGWASKLWKKAKEVGKDVWEGFKKGLGFGSPSLIERAFIAIGEQAFTTLKDIKRIVPKFQSEMFNITKPIPFSMTGTFGAQPQLAVTPPPVVAETTAVPAQQQPNQIVININGLTVREEADIEKIAQLLYRLQQKKSRGIGGVYSV